MLKYKFPRLACDVQYAYERERAGGVGECKAGSEEGREDMINKDLKLKHSSLALSPIAVIKPPPT